MYATFAEPEVSRCAAGTLRRIEPVPERPGAEESGPLEYNLADLFECVADHVPEREAVVCGERRLTFAQLDDRANRFAHALADRGVQPGEHVGLYLYSCAEFLEAMLGCYKLRAVPVNVN